jgi:hypothetical protein
MQPELNAELNAMSDDEFAAIIGAGTASGRPEAEPTMSVREKSDLPEVAEKRANKAVRGN